MSIRFFLGFESIDYIEPNILLCSIYMDSVILVSVLNLLKEVGVSVIFLLFVLERLTPDLPGVFWLATNFESTVPESMSTISASQKLGMSTKGSTVNLKIFPFLPVPLKREYRAQERYFSDGTFSNFKET